jgi:hypothetical protein
MRPPGNRRNSTAVMMRAGKRPGGKPQKGWEACPREPSPQKRSLKKHSIEALLIAPSLCDQVKGHRVKGHGHAVKDRRHEERPGSSAMRSDADASKSPLWRASLATGGTSGLATAALRFSWNRRFAQKTKTPTDEAGRRFEDRKDGWGSMIGRYQPSIPTSGTRMH